jgi:hypothetical protein
MRHITILGVVENGAPRGPRVPHDARVPLQLARGETVVLTVRAVTSDGAPVSLAGKLVAITAKKRSDNAVAALRAVVTPNGAVATLTLTATAAPGRYVFDLWAGADQIVPLSTLTITPAAGP